MAKKSKAMDKDDIHPLAKRFLWLDDPKVKKNFIWVSIIGLILTTLLGFFYPNKHPAPWEGGYLYVISYGVLGFLAYSFVVFSAWPLFKALARPETYYGEDPDGLDEIGSGEVHHD